MHDSLVRAGFGLPDTGAHAAGRDAKAGHDREKSGDGERFHDAVARRDGSRPQADSESISGAGVPSPFDLFGKPARPAEVGLAPRSSADEPPAALRTVIGNIADRIMISTEGEREVRILLRDDVLPGVELRLVQDRGRWVVRFAVTHAESHRLLCAHGAKAARELARRLGKGIEFRVGDPRDDEEEACRFVEDAAGPDDEAGA